MSAKLLKSLARNECWVKNVSSGEVIVYWKDDRRRMQNVVLRPRDRVVNLLAYASVAQLRKSPNLKNAFNRGLLRIASAPE